MIEILTQAIAFQLLFLDNEDRRERERMLQYEMSAPEEDRHMHHEYQQPDSDEFAHAYEMQEDDDDMDRYRRQPMLQQMAREEDLQLHRMLAE